MGGLEQSQKGSDVGSERQIQQRALYQNYHQTASRNT